MTFPLEEVRQGMRAVIKAFTSKRTQPNQVVEIMVKIADISRREGLVALEKVETGNPIFAQSHSAYC